MKVIDLLNKIANKEELPKIIKWDGFKYYWCEALDDWQNENEDLFLSSLNYVNEILNEEIEIIEEYKEIEESIKKLGKKLNETFKLMVESKKYYYPKIHEDLLEKEDKEIEEIYISKEGPGRGYFTIDENQEKWYLSKNEKIIVMKLNELIKAVNELKKGK